MFSLLHIVDHFQYLRFSILDIELLMATPYNELLKKEYRSMFLQECTNRSYQILISLKDTNIAPFLYISAIERMDLVELIIDLYPVCIVIVCISLDDFNLCVSLLASLFY